MRWFVRTMKMLSLITLFFFSWTFLPLFQVAAWAAQPPQMSGGKDQGVKSVGRGPTSGERFEKALEAIRENVSRAGDKGDKADKGEDDAKEREIIKSKRTEIDTLDIELKNEFAATEKKLKDAKLPQEILDRHAKFVKHYEDNLKELKTNLDDVEKATTKADRKAKIAKAKAHLEKTKTPSKHVPLDPNNLPFRTVKGKERVPRLKKEEFEKEFGPQKKQQTLKTAELWDADQRGWTRIVDSALRRYSAPLTPHTSRVLLASNTAIASDMPLDMGSELRTLSYKLSPSLPGFAFSDLTQNSELGTLNLAQASTDAPTAADLSETPEVQFTPEIQAKAAELGHNPVKIYEWVRNNIEFVPTYGSIQGAQMTMETKLGNAFDTASLLIALYRASGIPARYVYGTVEMPIEKVMNWVGGVTDPKMAGTILATNGIPAKMLISGGTYKAVQLEHVYVSAFIDYIPSRGAVNKQGDTWIPLDPSFKQYTFTQGIDIKAAVPFDAQTFADQIVSTATISETGSYVTNVNSTLVQQTMQGYQTQVQNYIQQNHPNATVEDAIGKKEIVKQEYGILVGTLPYKMIQAGSEFATVPDNLRAIMSFSIPDPTGASAGLSYATSLPQIAGKKITLSFSPATPNDQNVIESLFPQPHSDGTPIQPSELPSSFPAYMINLKPELRIEGQIVATGVAGGMGNAHSFKMSLNEPGAGFSNIDNIVNGGEYVGIGIDTGRTGAMRLSKLHSKLASTKVKLDDKQFDGLTKDDLVGDILYSTIMEYFAELDFSDEIGARSLDVIRYRVPSIGMFSLSLAVSELFGVPRLANPAGFKMDIDRIMQAVFSLDGNADKIRQYMLSSGMISSLFEYSVPETLLSTNDNPTSGISAVKALQIANNQNIPMFIVNQANINSALMQLQVASAVKIDIQNAVNAGKTVIVSKSNVTFNDWTGCGYIIIDPATNAGAYMLSNETSGAWLGLISGTIALYGVALIAGWLFVGAGIIAALIGAILIGLAIGLLLSQVLSNDAKAQLKQIAKQFKLLLGVLLGSGLLFGWWVIAIAVLIFTIIDIVKQLSFRNDQKYFLVTNEMLNILEA